MGKEPIKVDFSSFGVDMLGRDTIELHNNNYARWSPKSLKLAKIRKVALVPVPKVNDSQENEF